MRRARLLFLSLLLPLFFFAADAASAVSTGTYWRKPNQTLWVYDKTPELGIGSHEFGGSDVPVYRDLKLRLVRYTLYWNLGDNGTAYQEAYLQDFANKVYAATHDATGARNEIEPVIVVHTFARSEPSISRTATLPTRASPRSWAPWPTAFEM